MTHRTILRSLTTMFLVAVLGTSGWLFRAWLGSQPVAAAAVLGVSTDPSTASMPSLLPYPIQTSQQAPAIYAKEYLLYNVNSGKVLYSSENLDPVPIASTTKIMTSYLAALSGNLDDTLTVPQEAVAQGGSIMGLYTGEQVSLRNLLYGALMVSGNDAAYTIANYTGQKLLGNPNASVKDAIAREVEEMNATADALKMTSTHYMDPVGLNDEGHSNALDLAKLASVAYQNSVIKEIIGTATTTVTDVKGKSFQLRNSNHLTSDYFYEGNDGGKTGFTPAAGHCLVTTATRDGISNTAVILSTYSTSIEASAQEARKLLDFGFSSFRFE